MRFNYPKVTARTTVLAVLVLLLGASWAVAQQQINLIAGPTTITLPDGPMRTAALSKGPRPVPST